MYQTCSQFQAAVADSFPTATRASRGALFDPVFRALTQLCALLVALVVFSIFGVLLIDAWPALSKFGWRFLISDAWNPVKDTFGALSPTYGTLVTSAIAMLIGIPVSFGIALFITELAPALAQAAGWHRDRTAGRHPQHYLRDVGAVRVRAVFADNIQPWITDHLGHWPLIGRACFRDRRWGSAFLPPALSWPSW